MKSTRSFSCHANTIIPIFAMLILLIPAISHANADSIWVTTCCSNLFFSGETITVEGGINELLDGAPVSLIVVGPNDKRIIFDQLDVGDDKRFRTEFRVGGPLMEEGEYTVFVTYGSQQTAQTVFDFAFDWTTGTKSIQPIIDVKPYDSQRISIDVRFIDVVGQTIKHVNYSITAKYNSQTVLDDIEVYSHTGQSQHVTAPLQDIDSGTLDITITFDGIGISEPFGGPIGKTYVFEKSLGMPKNTNDSTPPLIITPQNIAKNGDSFGAIVHYLVKAIDDVDGVIPAHCNPSSGSFFSVGTTTVICVATDNSGNTESKSFLVKVEANQKTSIPNWIKNVASFWCNDEIDDSGFIEAIQYLVNNNVIVIESETDSVMTKEIPSWVKNNACWWSSDLISDQDFASGLQFLIQNEIIHVN